MVVDSTPDEDEEGGLACDCLLLLFATKNGVEQFEEIEDMEEPTAEVAEDFLRLENISLLSTTFGELIILSLGFSLDEAIMLVFKVR